MEAKSKAKMNQSKAQSTMQQASDAKTNSCHSKKEGSQKMGEQKTASQQNKETKNTKQKSDANGKGKTGNENFNNFNAKGWQDHQQQFTNQAKAMFENISGNFKQPKVDNQAIMNSHRNNLEALNDANKMAVEVMKSITNLQNQFVRQSFDDFNNMMREMISNPSNIANANSQASWQKNMDKTTEHVVNMGSILTESHQQINARLNERHEENLEELHAHTSKYKH